MEVIIITGLSGAGKSQAVNCMEDLGYYCIDNMPPRLIREFLALAESGTSGIDKAAFVVDIRQGSFFEDLKDIVECAGLIIHLYRYDSGLHYDVIIRQRLLRLLRV